MTRRLGIPGPKFGCACTQVVAPSLFIDWARKEGLTDAPFLVVVSEIPSNQTRVPWTCECPLVGYFPNGAKVDATCNRCGAPFRPKTKKTKIA
jgi:hypothetical protein